MRRATISQLPVYSALPISIHALLAESDKSNLIWRFCNHISIHALLAESDATVAQTGNRQRNFYPRSPCGERLFGIGQNHGQTFISIHALLAESDNAYEDLIELYAEFLSTLSLRRATNTPFFLLFYHILFLSTLSLRRATEGEHTVTITLAFLSTLSLRRATSTGFMFLPIENISIHALLAESDSRSAWPQEEITYFYPRSPCGERPCYDGPSSKADRFLSTLSLRRATMPV